jgi:hypothetical protein
VTHVHSPSCFPTRPGLSTHISFHIFSGLRPDPRFYLCSQYDCMTSYPRPLLRRTSLNHTGRPPTAASMLVQRPFRSALSSEFRDGRLFTIICRRDSSRWKLGKRYCVRVELYVNGARLRIVGEIASNVFTCVQRLVLIKISRSRSVSL